METRMEMLVKKPSSLRAIPLQESAKFQVFSIKNKINYKSQSYTNDKSIGIHFLMECSKKLSLECLTIATAASLFHRFFRNIQVSSQNYDQYLIATSCLYLAGKSKEVDFLKLRDLINVAYTTLHRDEIEPMEMNSYYYNMREAICQAELLVLRVIKFQVDVEHPHKCLLTYLKSLKIWYDAAVNQTTDFSVVCESSWAFLQDLYHDPRVIDLDTKITSLACIELALQSYGLRIPFAFKNEWYKNLYENATSEDVWKVTKIIMEVYENHEKLVSSNLWKQE